MKINKKYHIIILAAVILLIALTVWFTSVNNEDPTKQKNFETEDLIDFDNLASYENKKYNYSFSYPSYLKLGADLQEDLVQAGEKGDALFEQLDVFGITGFVSANPGQYFSLYIMGNFYPGGIDCGDFKNCVDTYKDGFKKLSDWKIIDDEEMVLSGREARVLKIERKDAGWFDWHVVTMDERGLLVLRFTTSLDQAQTGEKIYQAILGTFSFTK